MLDGIEKIAPLDVKHHVLERDAALGLELRILLRIPGEVFHTG